MCRVHLLSSFAFLLQTNNLVIASCLPINAPENILFQDFQTERQDFLGFNYTKHHHNFSLLCLSYLGLIDSYVLKNVLLYFLKSFTEVL